MYKEQLVAFDTKALYESNKNQLRDGAISFIKEAGNEAIIAKGTTFIAVPSNGQDGQYLIFRDGKGVWEDSLPSSANYSEVVVNVATVVTNGTGGKYLCSANTVLYDDYEEYSDIIEKSKLTELSITADTYEQLNSDDFILSSSVVNANPDNQYTYTERSASDILNSLVSSGTVQSVLISQDTYTPVSGTVYAGATLTEVTRTDIDLNSVYESVTAYTGTLPTYEDITVNSGYNEVEVTTATVTEQTFPIGAIDTSKIVIPNFSLGENMISATRKNFVFCIGGSGSYYPIGADWCSYSSMTFIATQKNRENETIKTAFCVHNTLYGGAKSAFGIPGYVMYIVSKSQGLYPVYFRSANTHSNLDKIVTTEFIKCAIHDTYFTFFHPSSEEYYFGDAVYIAFDGPKTLRVDNIKPDIYGKYVDGYIMDRFYSNTNYEHSTLTSVELNDCLGMIIGHDTFYNFFYPNNTYDSMYGISLDVNGNSTYQYLPAGKSYNRYSAISCEFKALVEEESYRYYNSNPVLIAKMSGNAQYSTNSISDKVFPKANNNKFSSKYTFFMCPLDATFLYSPTDINITYGYKNTETSYSIASDVQTQTLYSPTGSSTTYKTVKTEGNLTETTLLRKNTSVAPTTEKYYKASGTVTAKTNVYEKTSEGTAQSYYKLTGTVANTSVYTRSSNPDAGTYNYYKVSKNADIHPSYNLFKRNEGASYSKIYGYNNVSNDSVYYKKKSAQSSRTEYTPVTDDTYKIATVEERTYYLPDESE